MTITLEKIRDVVGGDLIGDGQIQIKGVAKIEEANKGDITFLANRKYIKFLNQTQASAILVPKDIKDIGDRPHIKTENPYLAFLKVVSIFHPLKPLIEKGVHPTAVIEEDTELGEDVRIGAYVVIGKKCHIGNCTVLMPGVVIGENVSIGHDCILHANVCLRENVVLGSRVIIHNGSVIGSDGFGFAPKEGVYHKIPQVGTVIIEDDVEIGANVTIDRATLGETRIHRGTKLDNLIQIGHNCTVGENTVIAAQTGISGSTHLGKNVRVGGQAGFQGHIHVGNGATVGGQAGVTRSVPEGVMVSGYPARPHHDSLRIEAAMHHLPQLLKEFKALKKKMAELEKGKGENAQESKHD
jgi:UDP-3-O-[3-hydroxymyristoyl] glucosamine N-acyltransferase